MVSQPTLAALTNGRVVEIIASPSGRPVKVPVATWTLDDGDALFDRCTITYGGRILWDGPTLTAALTKFRDDRYPDHLIDDSSL
jgi:hypothetical protein